MFAGVCVGGWDRGVGEVVVFSMGTRLLTAATEKSKSYYINILKCIFCYFNVSNLTFSLILEETF